MKVVAYDPYASAEKAAAVGVTLVTFDEALAQADFFSLHMPLTPGTKNMFNDAAFAKMKKGARIMNVARGGVIEDEALARALDAGIVAAAALDVFEEEPPTFEGHPLIGRWVVGDGGGVLVEMVGRGGAQRVGGGRMCVFDAECCQLGRCRGRGFLATWQQQA